MAGVSVGALNAAMLAMHKYAELELLWNSISDKSIYKSYSKLRSAVRVLFGKSSVMANTPLEALIKKHVVLEDFDPAYDVGFGAVSLTSGAYHTFKPEEFSDSHGLCSAVLASTAIPLIWPPVKTIRTKNNLIYSSMVDGGIRNISPLGDVIDKDPTDIIIINCSNPDIEISSDPKAGDNFMSIALRTLSDIMSNEIFLTDLREFLTINHIVKEAAPKTIPKKNGKGVYQAYNTILIQPEKNLGDTLDFSPSMLQARISEGYATAEKAFQKGSLSHIRP